MRHAVSISLVHTRLFGVVLFLALVSPFYFSRTTGAVNRVSTTTKEGRLSVFDDVWETIATRYYDPDFNGVNWVDQRTSFRALAAAAEGSADLYTLLRRMIGSLGDAHTRIYAPEERFEWQHPRAIGIGFSVMDVDGAPTVVAVDRGSEAERRGIKPGYVVLRVDGEPALALINRRLHEQVRSSTPQAARTRAISLLFDGEQGSTADVVWMDANGEQKGASFLREWRARDPAIRVRRNHAGYYVVALTAFTPSIATEFVRNVRQKVRGARGLVLDLRGNGGGDAQAMVEIASALLPTGTSMGKFLDRTGQTTLELTTNYNLISSARAVSELNCPIIILTNARTSSAAEIFAEAMKDAHRASIIGTQTCGCVLAVRQKHTLPDGGELDVSEMDYLTVNGTRLEGVGVSPEMTIALDRRDLRAGVDRAMDMAFQRLKNRGGLNQ